MLDKRLRRIVSVDEMQFGFMSERGTIDAVFILGRMQEEYPLKRGMCVLWTQRKLLTEYRRKCWNGQ